LTISTTVRKAGPYNGNGFTTAFAFAFKVFGESDVLVVQTVVATATDTTKVLTTDYTVTLNGDQNANPGGVVTMLVAPPIGNIVTISSVVPNLQPTNLTNLGGFYPTVINDALDRLTILAQQLAEKADRSPQISISTGLALPLAFPNPVPNFGIVWNADGTALISGALTTTPASAFMQTVLDDADAAAARATLGALAATNGTATNLQCVHPDLQSPRETINSVTGSGTVTVDCNAAAYCPLTLTGNVTTLSLTNVPASPKAFSLTLEVIQGGSGSYTIAWPGAVKWPAAVAPTLTTTVGKADVVTLVTRDGGASWLGFVAGQNF
jgi:hypothetical protein